MNTFFAIPSFAAFTACNEANSFTFQIPSKGYCKYAEYFRLDIPFFASRPSSGRFIRVGEIRPVVRNVSSFAVRFLRHVTTVNNMF